MSDRTLRLITQNVWGVSVRDPMLRPRDTCLHLKKTADKEGWTDSPFVVALQEVYAFRLDPLSFVIAKAVQKLDHLFEALFAESYPMRIIFLMWTYCSTILLHAIIVLINALILYPINKLRHRFIPSCIFDMKGTVIPVVSQLYEEIAIIGHSNITMGQDLSTSGDAGLLLISGRIEGTTDHGFESFTASTGSEISCNKGLLWKVFHSQRYCVINSHMQALDDPFRHLFGDGAAYQVQVAQVRTLISSLQKEFDLDYVFLIGDLNTMNYTTEEVEETFGLFQLSTHVSTHVDGCVDHVLCKYVYLFLIFF